MKKIYILLWLILATTACHQRKNTVAATGDPPDNTVMYARGFRMEKHDGYTKVSIRNPWDTATFLQHYILIERDKPVPSNLPQGTVVRIPVRKAVVYSSVHCGVLEALGVRDELVGVCETRYIDVDFVKKGVAEGRIADLGESASPDIEKIIEASPEIILTSPLESMSYGRVEKIGVPLLECTDYMEVTPLGRAEWIRLIGLFFGKEAFADSLFRCTEESYHAVKELAANVRKRPTVISETRTGAVWYMPGGRSYVGHLFQDAGADYPWKDDASPGSIGVSFEGVLEKGGSADVWVLKYNKPKDMTYGDLENEYPGYRHFAAFKNRAVFACNTAHAPYYEELPIHPDRVLKDFVWIFHPELLPDHQPRYFKKMRE